MQDARLMSKCDVEE